MPYGFPSARRLRTQVINFLLETSPNRLQSDLLGCGFRESELAYFATSLRDSGQLSIDAFLEHRIELCEIGKAAIVASLIPHEDPESLHSPEVEGGWYDFILERMAADPREFEANKLTIITFNYDRSIERFFLDALRNNFLFNPDRLRSVFEAIPIIHVYGELGSLPLGPSSDGKFLIEEIPGRPYSPEVTRETVKTCSAGIEILQAGSVDSTSFEEAKRRLSESHVICFLGFGYNKINLTRLGFPQIRDNRRILGTAYSLGSDEKRRAKEHVGQSAELGEPNEDALRFLREHHVLD